MKSVRDWLGKMLSEGDGSPSTKRVLFALVVVTSLAFSGWEISRSGLAGSVDLLKTLIVTAAAYGVRRFAETRDGG